MTGGRRQRPEDVTPAVDSAAQERQACVAAPQWPQSCPPRRRPLRSAPIPSQAEKPVSPPCGRALPGKRGLGPFGRGLRPRAHRAGAQPRHVAGDELGPRRSAAQSCHRAFQTPGKRVFLRLGGAAVTNPGQTPSMSLVAFVIAAVDWRFAWAANLPRAVLATVLAPLSHMLMNGFFFIQGLDVDCSSVAGRAAAPIGRLAVDGVASERCGGGSSGLCSRAMIWPCADRHHRSWRRSAVGAEAALSRNEAGRLGVAGRRFLIRAERVPQGCTFGTPAGIRVAASAVCHVRPGCACGPSAEKTEASIAGPTKPGDLRV